MLALMLERVQRARVLDGVVVATTARAGDDAVAAVARDAGAGVFRGSEEDVLERVVGAAASASAEVIVELTGDCPLLDGAIIDKVAADFRIGGADFVSNIFDYTTPRGTDVRVFTAQALAEIAARSSDPADREHVSLHFWEHPEKYRLRNVETHLGPEAPKLRLTVDTAEDLALIRAIFEELYPGNPEFSLFDVLELCARRPELARINQAIQQKAVR